MSDIAIRVESVFKCYQVYGKPHDRLKQAVLPHAQRLLGRPLRKYFAEFWALRGISFEVLRGQTVGIIGRNGSGKSTLLQIVCGTLTPTAGRVDVDGRVAALLELGSGFNPEFTGRENVYLNGNVLGLSREQVDQRFEDIELFADIGEFIDQPVKTYSSGMVVRLAFAVIAHVDADVLVIDEALAVGDAVFTQKCMRFLRSFKEKGTILFVSHDASSILNLCDRAVWIHQGEMRMQGTAEQVSNAYLEFTTQEVYGDELKLHAVKASRGETESEPVPLATGTGQEETRLEFFDNIANSDGWESGVARIDRVEMHDESGTPCTVLRGGERVKLSVLARCDAPLASPIIGFFVKDRLGQSLFGDNTYSYRSPVAVEGGTVLQALFTFHLPMLPNGRYSMTVAIADGDPFNHVQHHWLHDALAINVASPKLRYGLVGIPFENVTLEVVTDKDGY